jgi:hypothetical protein
LDSSRLPWNKPQSINRRLPFSNSSKCFDPVTVRAAPQNVSLMVPLHSLMKSIPCLDTSKREILSGFSRRFDSPAAKGGSDSS